MIVVTGAAGFIGKHLFDALLMQYRDIVQIDLKYGSDILTCGLPDAERVYHLAAQTDAYSTDVLADARTNIIGSLRIFERYREKVVFTSSAMVNYPVNPYAISKKTCEAYARLYGCAVLRLPNVYGDGGHSFIDKCKANRKVDIFGDGSQVRTWVSIGSVINALLLMRESENRVLYGVEKSIDDIADSFGCIKNYLPERPGDIVNGVQR